MSSLDNIKKAFIKRKKAKRSKKRVPILKPLDAYKEILIFSNEDKSALTDVISTIFKQAKITFCYERYQKEDDTGLNSYSYHLGDLNLTGKIKNDKLNQLVQTPFDLVLDLSNEEQLPLFILEKLNQSFMIGKKGLEKVYLYDLIIENYEKDGDFLNTIKQQITLLSKNGNN